MKPAPAPASPKQYTIILFDLGNTVIRFDHGISARKIAARCGTDEGKIYETFFDSALTRLFDSGKITPREFYMRVSRDLGLKIPYSDFVSVWSDIFWPDEASCALARELKRTHRLFIISNINRLHFDFIMERFGDDMRLFEGYILSYQVGCLKPDRRIYEDAARQGNARFSDILYIDDREDLIVESTAMGIDSIRFENAAQLRDELIVKRILKKKSK